MMPLCIIRQSVMVLAKVYMQPASEGTGVSLVGAMRIIIIRSCWCQDVY